MSTIDSSCFRHRLPDPLPPPPAFVDEDDDSSLSSNVSVLTPLAEATALPPDQPDAPPVCVSWPDRATPCPCPMPSCSGHGIVLKGDYYNMRRHFALRHPGVCFVIPQESPTPLPVCVECGMAMKRPNERHRATKTCKLLAARRRRRERSTTIQATMASQQFFIGGVPLESVSSFRYLGRMLSSNDSDLVAVKTNLQKARRQWGRICSVLCKSDVPPKVMGYFYKTIVQSVLLYGSETWALSTRIRSLLASFHKRCARHLTGRHVRPLSQDPGSAWVYPDTTTTLKLARLHPVETYIRRRRRTILRNYAAGRQLLQQCRNARRPHPSIIPWWSQIS